MHNRNKNKVATVHTCAKKTSGQVSQLTHGSKKHVCSECKVSFKVFANLKRHMTKYHPIEGNHQSCMISTCLLKFRTVDHQIEHAVNVHEADINTEDLIFDSFRLFSDFRTHEELIRTQDLSVDQDPLLIGRMRRPTL